MASSVVGWSPPRAAFPTYLLVLGKATTKLFYGYLGPNTNSKMWIAPQDIVLKWLSLCRREFAHKKECNFIPYTYKGKAENRILSFCCLLLPYDGEIQGPADKFFFLYDNLARSIEESQSGGTPASFRAGKATARWRAASAERLRARAELCWGRRRALLEATTTLCPVQQVIQ